MKKHTTNNILLFLFVSVLYGCGAEGNNTANNQELDTASPNTETLYQAVDAIRTGPLSETFYLDLSSNISSNDGSEVSVIHVASMSSDSFCAPISVDDKGFTIDATSANVCEYRYSVGAKSTRSITPMAMAETEESASTATARAAVGETVTILAPLSSATSEGIAIPIDVSNGGAIDTGVYTLSSDVTMPYGTDSGSSAVASPSTNKITYTPGAGFLGVERISYSYSDGTNILTGDIDVSVSTSSNNAPTSSNFQFQDSVTGSTLVENGALIAIDVSSFVSDADEDAVTLQDVISYDATVSVTSDSTLEFSSTVSGVHYVTYVVSDGKGGYSSAVVSVTIEPQPSMVRDWQDITYNDTANTTDVTITAPMSKAEADYVRLPYSDTHIGDGVHSPAYSEITLHSFDEAMEICKSMGGRLPTQGELEQSIQLFRSNNWPTDGSYWVGSRTDQGINLIGADQGWSIDISPTNVVTVSQELRPNPNLVTCMLYDSPEVRRYSIDQTSLQVVDGKTPYRFQVLTPDLQPAHYAKNVYVTAGIEKNGYFKQEYYDTDEFGWVDADYTDLSFENNVGVVSVYDIVKEQLISIDSEADALSVKDAGSWNRRVTSGSGMPAVDANFGLPITFKGIKLTSVYNVQSYTGSTLIGHYYSYQNVGVGSGTYSFYLQQVGDTPASNWGKEVWRPGGPASKNFEVVIDIFRKEVNIFVDSDTPKYTVTDIDLQGDRYVWFEVKNNRFKLYTSLVSEKPETALFDFEMDWGSINPNSEYWIGFGGRAYDACETYINEASFRAEL
ncbi:hypothetical protein [Vibrio sp. 1CM8B]|uniref:Ig-like domain-containing protein n=1 Tax=Vibrio sp. 1CM8B TaxID=2929167 RepID=UPI0020BEA10B|nr:hypothetical protein [Vibrio sp. 1CM8B]MCK8084000.1 hypothetical protein [Vibrio sp. 1CM8B]